MDDQGRLHMPNGFIGKTFKELGIGEISKQEASRLTEGNRAERRKKIAIVRKAHKESSNA